VIQTTPINEVVPDCAALWQAYGVTAVPPANELQVEHVPAAAHVTNKTNGAVSDADAKKWADAGNWDSGWFKWAEANDQPALLSHLAAPTVLNRNELQLLEQGATIDQPDCAIYPSSATLYPITPDDAAYFARKNLQINDQYVLVLTYSGPCTATVMYPDGRTISLAELTGAATAFAPGVLRDDPLLGDIWFSDGSGTCTDPAGPPAEWCGR
jgi:hypothetical protein